MSNQSPSLAEHWPTQIKHSSESKEGLLAWRYYRSRKIATFTREVHDFPNATVAINVGPSAGWVEQLAGITNVSVGVASGPDITGQIGVNQIVGTGLFVEGIKRISFGQGAHLVTGFVEGFDPSLYVGDLVYGKPEAVALLGNVQQITMVEPVGAATLAHFAFAREHSLSEQLGRLSKLPEGWDGDTAQPISQATCETAQAVIKQTLQLTLSHSSIPTTVLGPLPDGSLRFECTYANKELFLTILDKAVEVQEWQPRDAVESLGYWETDAAGAREHLEWLVK